jgi:hypothetical protein
MKRMLATAATLLLLVSSVLADSPHFIGSPKATLDTTNGDYLVSFKEAGLGNTPVTYDLDSSSATFTFQCFNHGGNNPQGAPNGISFSNLSSQTTITPHNGQITATVTLAPELDGASCQGQGLELFLIGVSWTGMTLTDTTNNIGPIALPDLSATGLKIGPF